jgi:hypothetical protein
MATTTTPTLAADPTTAEIKAWIAGLPTGKTVEDEVSTLSFAQQQAVEKYVFSSADSSWSNSANPVSGAIDAAGSTINSVGSVAALVTSTSFWIRLGEGILGALLILLGLKAMTGASIPVSV